MALQTLGPFDLDGKIGRGGMGIVYRATYRKNGRTVALKVLTPELTTNPKLVARFEREMQILEKLDHPNVTRYYGGGHKDGRYFYAMKLMSSGTLDRLLKKKGPLPWEQVVDYGIQICGALDHAHEQGIVHRDLKPANLFLRREKDSGADRIVLGDFGIARDQDADGLTATGMTVGTYAYMAPEQINLKKSISARTDLYALGCVLFEMLTGRTPFVAESSGELMVQHLQELPPLVREHAPDCPIWLERVVMQLLSKEPEDRQDDAGYVAMALEEVREKVATQAGVAAQAVAGGPSTLASTDAHPELTKLIVDPQKKRKEQRKRKKKRDSSPVWERGWFLSLCLLALAGLVTWSLWPLSEQELYARARPLMDSEDTVQWSDAVNQYLRPMLRRHPDGEHADEARNFIEFVVVDRLKRRLMTNARLNKEPESEAERLIMDAWRYENFGDRITALERYRSMKELLSDRPDAEEFVRLARYQIGEIERDAVGKLDRAEFLRDVLISADDMATNGHMIAARKKWHSIASLYGGNQELAPFVEYASARISGQHVATPWTHHNVTQADD